MGLGNSRSLGSFARRAARRELALSFEKTLVSRTALGLAIATAILLAALAGLAWTDACAPEADEMRIASLALAAASVLAAVGTAAATALASRPSPLGTLLRMDVSLAAALELEGQDGVLARIAVDEARETAKSVDLARALPRRAPEERFGASVLLVSSVSLAVLLATREAPRPGLSLGPGASAPSHRAEETRAVHDAAKLLAAQARELARLEGGREAALELAQAARELDAGSTRKAALGRIARSRGKLEAARAPGLADALDRAAASLADSPALRDVARALERADAAGVEQAGEKLERKIQDGLDEASETRMKNAAARAAQALQGTQGASEARSELEKLSEASAKDAQAQAAKDAAKALAQASERAKKDRASERASRALDDARATASGAPRKEKTEPRPGGGNARQGEKREAPNPQAGGDGPRVAGKGGTNDTEAPSSGDARGAASSETAALKGLVGERGASAVMAVEGLAKGDAPQARATLQEYRRTEEEALDREPLPLDRRRLVQRYFDRLEKKR